MPVIDKICYVSRLRYMNTGEKFAFSFLTLIACLISRSVVMALLVLAVMSAINVGKSGIAPGRYMKLMLIPFGFLLAGTAAVMVNVSGEPLDAFALPVGGLYLTGSKEGIFRGVQMVSTALASVSCLYFLSFSTPMTDMLTLFESWRLPSVLTELMLLTYRFLFILLETAAWMTVSQRSRLGDRDKKTWLRCRGMLASSLFLLAIRRAGAIYDAMESRCYDGTIHMLRENRPPKAGEILKIAGFEALLIGMILADVTKWEWMLWMR